MAKPKAKVKGEPGWKKTWDDPVTGASVSLEEANALVRMDFASPCGSHKKGVLCRMCLPTLEAALAAAKRAIDPGAPVRVEDAAPTAEFPPMLALFNPVSVQAFAMRLDRPKGVVAVKQLLTTENAEAGPLGTVRIFDYTTDSAVCDAILARSFRVKLKDGAPEGYPERIGESLFTLEIDGEKAVDSVPFKHILSLGEIPFARPTARGSCLFPAHPLKDAPMAGPSQFIPSQALENVDTAKWLGFMLPNGTRVVAILQGVPAGGGLVEIEVGLDLANYTTKAA